MSHITTLAIKSGGEIDLEVLKLAAQVSGGEFLENQTTYECYSGGWMGDTPPPEGWDPSMWGKCEHAIRYPGCRYEVGIIQLNGEYRFAWDYWRSGGLLERLGGEKAPVLEDALAKATRRIRAEREIARQARVRGERVVERQPLKTGGIKMVIEVRS